MLLQVGTNGFVFFGSTYIERTGDFNLFPNLNQFLVAPYWTDIDLRVTGRVAYKLIYTSSTSNNKVLQNINQFLAQNQTLKFSATWGLVASWEETCPFGNRECTNIKVMVKDMYCIACFIDLLTFPSQTLSKWLL